MLRNLQGVHAPLRLQMERKSASQVIYQSLLSVLSETRFIYYLVTVFFLPMLYVFVGICFGILMIILNLPFRLYAYQIRIPSISRLDQQWGQPELICVQESWQRPCFISEMTCPRDLGIFV